MTIEAELIEFLDGNIKSGGNKKRDIEIIKYYYGLHESPWPTLDETANRFNIGTRGSDSYLIASLGTMQIRILSLHCVISLIFYNQENTG
jgi:hypothetical protein